MAIRNWPEGERPREKLIHLGPEALSDAELLAIFLRTGRAGQTAVDLARELLIHFDGLGSLLESSLEQFSTIKGLGVAKYTQLQATRELVRRHLSEGLRREPVFTGNRDVERYLLLKLQGRKQEVFAVMFLDVRQRLLAFEELFQGTIDGAAVYPRVVVGRALELNAAAVILAHNHPSGVAEPSTADEQITRTLRDALDLMEVRLLDHLIVGRGRVYSMAAHGRL